MDQKIDQILDNFENNFHAKSSFQKTLNVLKPLVLLCRMHFAEGSPIKKAIKKVKKKHLKSMPEK